MSRRLPAFASGAVVALALASAAATCRGEERQDEAAVPAEVEIDWPDAATSPPPTSGEHSARDAGP